jgi:hypothetical protein
MEEQEWEKYLNDVDLITLDRTKEIEEEEEE